MRAKLFVLAAVLSLVLPAIAAAADERDTRTIQEKLVAQATNAKGAAAMIRIAGDKPEPILAFSWGASNSGSFLGSGGGAGKASLQDFHFAKSLSSSSSSYFSHCVTGTHIPTATIEILDEKGTAVAKIVLKDVLVSSYQFGGSAGAPTMDAVSLTYGAVDYFILIGL